MDFYHESDYGEDTLYNKQVTRFLFSYLFRYKRFLIVSILLLIVITIVALASPYISKILIDRYVVKSGYIIVIDEIDKVNEKSTAQTMLATDTQIIPSEINSVFYHEKIKNALGLKQNEAFLFQSELRFFTQKQIETLKASKIWSSTTFVLAESKDIGGILAIPQIQKGYFEGLVKVYTGKAAIAKSIYDTLTLNEIMYIRKQDFRIIGYFAIALIFFFVLQFIANYFQTMNLMKMSQLSMRDLRMDLFNKLMVYEINYYDTNPIGKLVNRVTNDIEVLNEMFSSVFVSLVQDFIILTGIVIIMFRENIYLALAVAITFPVLFFLTIIFRVKSTQVYRKIREIIARFNGFLAETISGIRIIQIFVAELKNLKKFTQINMQLYKANIQQLNVFAVFRPLIDFLRWFSVASVLYFGTKGLANHTISYGIIVLFLQYISYFFEPISDLSEKFDILISANAAGEKILQVMNAGVYEEISTDKDVLKYENMILKHNDYKYDDRQRFKGEVKFDTVWFSYVKNQWVLKDVSFALKPKQTIAIVGETGSGKSTIISLLMHFYRIQKGQILIDGMNLGTIPYAVLRKNISVVMQDVFLFSKTVRENIILNAPYDEERYKFVCRITHVDKFIEKLPNKDDEMVMERGVTFSSGERQLVSFARALYYDPSILILDEATSNIDSETESLIQDAILHLIEGRSSIVIAHRLSTIKHADTILVLDQGKIVEQGIHEELLRKKGIYYNLYRLQFQDA